MTPRVRRARRKGARVPGPNLEVRAERRHLRLSRGHGVASARRGRARMRGRGAHVANEHPAALGRLVVVAFPFCRSSVHVDGWLVLEPRVTRRLRFGRGHVTRSRERRRRHAPGVLCLVPGVSASLRWGEREPRIYKKLTRRLLRHEIRTSAEFRERFDFVARFSFLLRFSFLRSRTETRGDFRAPARGLFLGLPEINRDHRERRVGATHPPLCDDVAR